MKLIIMAPHEVIKQVAVSLLIFEHVLNSVLQPKMTVSLTLESELCFCSIILYIIFSGTENTVYKELNNSFQ